MPVKLIAVQQTLQVAIANATGPEAARKLASFAKQSLSEAITSGRASPNYVRTVNGRIGVPEENVRLPGPIVYRFSWLDEVVIHALEYLHKRSPIGPPERGHYRDTHQVLIGGSLIGDSGDPQAIRGKSLPISSEVVISNAMPYSRKIEVGAMTMTVAPRVYEDARKEITRRYSQFVRATVRFIDRSDGYVLRQPSSRSARRRRPGSREALTYPALILSLRD